MQFKTFTKKKGEGEHLHLHIYNCQGSLQVQAEAALSWGQVASGVQKLVYTSGQDQMQTINHSKEENWRWSPTLASLRTSAFFPRAWKLHFALDICKSIFFTLGSDKLKRIFLMER